MKNFETQLDTISTPSQVHLQKPKTQRDLRYILTQKCNYQCSFCHKEGCDGSEKELFTPEDYVYFYSVVKSNIPLCGVTISGGEPLISKNLKEILARLKYTGAFLTMVTNGYFIDKKIEEIGFLDRINISLHTFQQDIYENIVGKNVSIDHIIQNILLVKKKYPDLDIRINSTLLKSFFKNNNHIYKLLEFIQEHNITLKYLELSPKFDPLFISNDSIIPFLQKKGFVLQSSPNNFSKDEKIYIAGGSKVILRQCACDFVQNHGLHQNFCKENNDIVMSPDGKISSCIVDTKKVDIYQSIKQKNNEKLIYVLKTLQSPSFNYSCCLDTP